MPRNLWNGSLFRGNATVSAEKFTASLLMDRPPSCGRFTFLVRFQEALGTVAEAARNCWRSASAMRQSRPIL